MKFFLLTDENSKVGMVLKYEDVLDDYVANIRKIRENLEEYLKTKYKISKVELIDGTTLVSNLPRYLKGTTVK